MDNALFAVRRSLLVLALGVGLCGTGSAASLSVSPAAVSNEYSGLVSVHIAGLTNGETVLVEKFLDVNANTNVNAIDTLMRSFLVTDGRRSVLGGVTNLNVPGDLNPTNGVITTALSFEGGDLDLLVGRYIFRLSSPTGRFAATNVSFRVTNSAYAQTVTGRVRSSGTNVPYGIVAFLKVSPGEGSEFAAGTVAASNGLFTIKLPAGTYQVVGAKRGFVDDLVTADTVVLAPGAPVSNNVSILPATRTLSGRIIDASNTSQGLAGVQLFVNSTNDLFALGVTDSNGWFNVPVSAGVWTLEPDAEALCFLGYPGPQESPVADTTSGDVTNLWIPVPRATALIYGTVKAVSGTPIPGVEIYASSSDGSYETRTQTDALGYFTLGVSPSIWWVGASSSDLAQLGFLDTNWPSATVTNGEALRMDLTLQPFTSRLFGQVLDDAGNPVGEIGLSGSHGPGSYSHTRTAEDGRFQLGVVGGTWHLQLGREEATERRLVYPNPQVDVVEGQDVTNLTYRVLRATNTISGTALDHLGNPVAGVDVYGYSSAQIGGQTYYAGYAMSGADGSFVIYVADGTWLLGLECYGVESLGYDCPGMLTVAAPGGTGRADFILRPPPGPVTLVAPRVLPNGECRFQITGPAGYGYIVESSEDLFSWSSVFFTTNANPPIEFTDSGAPGTPHRYYRAQRFQPGP
jgi:hypothetical protein